MRLEVFSAFELGFAGGLMTLTVLLYAGGVLPKRTEAPCATPALAAQATGKPALAMPIAGVDPARLRSNFYEMHNNHPHEALDIMAPRGTPVLAVDHGAVVKLFTSKQGGLTVYQFDDAQELCYYYAHLDHYAEGLKEGQVLRRGELLGYVGSTGNASPSAPHLHFAVSLVGSEHRWWETKPIDPLPLLLLGAKPH